MSDPRICTGTIRRDTSTTHPGGRLRYNHLEAIMPEVQEAPGAGFSEACEVNINCEEGADWQEQKKGVIQMIQYIRNKEGEGGSYICTASLVNNTAL